MPDRGHLSTEHTNPRSAGLGVASVGEAFDILSTEDAGVAAAVAAEKASICAAVELAAGALSSGRRLIYVGAGTSGRLGVLDAAECPPTFLSDPDSIVGIIAGGREALVRSIEGAEDDPSGGAAAMEAVEVSGGDVVVGIATGGTTPFVHGALARAKALGARTVFLACVPKEQVEDDADVSIRVVTGPEVVTGSTRMKAGTATKMVLNMISTIAHARLGKVYRNLMVDVNTKANAKLVDRGVRILMEVLGVSRDAAADLLDAADGHVKTAIAMRKLGASRQEAAEKLASAGGRLADIVE